MYSFPQNSGWIEVICGSMFSGKSEELIRRLKRAQIAKQKIQVFKPKIDNRYDDNAVVTHDTVRIDGIAVFNSQQLLALVDSDTKVVGIDEIHFFDQHIASVCNQLADRGHRVICAGLDMDFRGKPFGPMPELLSLAEYVTKVAAVCTKCGNPATRTQRTSDNLDVILIGEKENYDARCRKCHVVPIK